MPFLKKLLADAVHKAASDPRVREAAKQIYEDKVKPTAEAAWAKAKPGIEDGLKRAQPMIEEAWEQAKPRMAEATRKAAGEASALAGRVKRELRQRAAMRSDDRPET